MFIDRKIEQKVISRFAKGKVILIYGPRQSGKTTLVRKIMDRSDKKLMYLSGDEADVREILHNTTSTRLKSIIGKSELVVIDEAQGIPGIGLTLKLIVDHLEGVQVIATGSSAFELADVTAEPLTGRKYEFHLFPFSFGEMVTYQGLLEERRLLAERLVFGYYPEIVVKFDEKEELLRLLSGSYLYKDLLMLESVKKPLLLQKIIKVLALQIGSEMSFNEISNLVGADAKTVAKYIDLLEKAYVIFSLPGFSRNARTEIRKGRKVYFYDNGVRNAVIGNFNSIENRVDIGALWENFLISERIKKLRNEGSFRKSYFWRTTNQQEVDYIEEDTDLLNAFEFKWNIKKKKKFPKTFVKNYSNASTEIITPENFDSFLA